MVPTLVKSLNIKEVYLHNGCGGYLMELNIEILKLKSLKVE
jgi:hypothetical protein